MQVIKKNVIIKSELCLILERGLKMKQLQILKDSGKGVRVAKTVERVNATEIYDYIACNEFEIYKGNVGLIDDILLELKRATKREPEIFNNCKNQLKEINQKYTDYIDAQNNDKDYLIDDLYYQLQNLIFDLMQYDKIADLILSENLIDYLNYIN